MDSCKKVIVRTLIITANGSLILILFQDPFNIADLLLQALSLSSESESKSAIIPDQDNGIMGKVLLIAGLIAIAAAAVIVFLRLIREFSTVNDPSRPRDEIPVKDISIKLQNTKNIYSNDQQKAKYIDSNDIQFTKHRIQKEKYESTKVPCTKTELIKPKESRQEMLARISTYLDLIQSAQKSIRQAMQCYEEDLNGLPLYFRNTIKASFDEKFKAAIPPMTTKITSAEVEKWSQARLIVFDLFWAVKEDITRIKNPRVNLKLIKQHPVKQKDTAINPYKIDRNNNHCHEDIQMEKINHPTAHQSLYSHAESFAILFEKSLKPLSDDPLQTTFLAQGRRAVTATLIKITGTEQKQAIQDFSHLMTGKDVMVFKKRFNSSAHPLGPRFMTMCIAGLFQGFDYSSRFAPFYAKVTVQLASQFPDLLRLYRFILYNLVPLMGSDAIWTKGDVERVMRQYATIITTQPDEGLVNPFELEEAWEWLAKVLNIEPVEYVSAVAVTVFLEVAGDAMQKAYGRQFGRMLKSFQGPYLRKLMNVGGKRDAIAIGRFKRCIEGLLEL